MIAILHNIRSLHNVGAIFRTADAAGIESIFLTGITPAPFDSFGNPQTKLLKVSLGAEHFVPWTKVYPLAILIKKLKQQGYKIYALEQHKCSIPYFQLKLTKKSKKKSVLIVGNEITGLPPKTLKQCEKILEIPMSGQKESLNVAVAFGIVVYHLLYCR